MAELTAKTSHRRRWIIAVGVVAVVIAGVVGLWDWNWFRPLAERQASAFLGRKVGIAHLTVRPGRQTVVIAEGITIASPDGFAGPANLATIERITATIDAAEYLRSRAIVIPSILIERPQAEPTQTADGAVNYRFPALAPAQDGTAARIGALRVTDGHAHVVLAPLRADFTAEIQTREGAAGHPAQVVAEVKGSYAAQPITGQIVGGRLLALGDASTPYPIDMKLQNGPTRVTLVGTVRNPLNFSGADLELEFNGTDMALLLPITGVAFPKTPSYQIKGKLDYGEGKIRFHRFAGMIGSSDVQGDMEIDPAPARPVITATVNSRALDLADLGGFVGSEPGRMSTPNQTAEQKQAVARAVADPRLLPTVTISLPKLLAADVHLVYRAAKIQGRNMPFDSFAADMDIVDGHIMLHPVTLGIGKGRIAATLELSPIDAAQFRTKGDIAVQKVDVGRILAATDLVEGSGLIGGRATIDTTGNSTATMLGNADGTLQLTMAGGGTLSALLVDLSGLQLGNAVLSALGIPARDKIECFVADFALKHGTLVTRSLLLDTTDDIITGAGTIDLRRETVDYRLKTDSKHFSIGTLPAPIAITGTFKNAGAMPDIATLGARGGAAVGLGILFPPAALLPTIQFGVGDDNRCAALAKRAAK